jgi:hypothetical protein
MTVLDDILERANSVVEQHEEMRRAAKQIPHDWTKAEAMPHRHHDEDAAETQAKF